MFHPTGKRTRCKAVGRSGQRLLSMVLHINIDHVTVMSVFIATGLRRKPIVVYDRANARYRKVRKGANKITEVVETVQDHLMEIYFHQRDPAGVDSAILANSADMFISEICSTHMRGEKVMLFSMDTPATICAA